MIAAGVDGVEREMRMFGGIDGIERELSQMYGAVDGVQRELLAVYDPVFANNDWDTIIRACHTKTVPASWVSGDSKMMTYSNKEIQVDIIGRDHDEYADGSGIAPLTFQTHDSVDYTMIVEGNYNTQGWVNCFARLTALPQMLDVAFSENIRNGIRKVRKKTKSGTSTSMVITEDALFLLAEIEYFGYTKYSYPGEGEQYEYYREGNSVIKKWNGNDARHWGRGPRYGDNWRWCTVEYNGIPEFYPVTNQSGVSPAWCF